MDSFDGELGAVFGHGLPNYVSRQSDSSLSSSTMINVLSSNSLTSSLYNFPTKFPSIFDDTTAISRLDHQASSTPIILNFDKANTSGNLPKFFQQANPMSCLNIINPTQRSQQKNKKTRTRPPSQTYDHIIAERKRREQLGQLFIALSAIIPGLKKTDKTSILGDAISYLKHLRERVEVLEVKAAEQTMDSIVVKKSQIIVDEEGSSDERSVSSDEKEMPEIEVRLTNNSILLRVHCSKQKGVLANLLSKVESLDMVVVNTNVTPFGTSALDVTITAEMEKEFSLTVKEVATVLRAALRERVSV
ncbi:hypothetical protein CDL12_17347 [Handroanthus impetiginosus]|uniref:BHLH domain-containing protein n=1 Tax=Handroanthus impetiginosus TaxID=429701 RepID=A0A2G9GYI5_9LAMI|nr:hypothetical protein CDL12_17347 [Handroanthus impetiginosus]